MESNFNRRHFLKSCTQIGSGCAVMLLCRNGWTQDSTQTEEKEPSVPNPSEMTYCGYKCSMACPLYKATIENDLELKKKAYTEFKWKEQYGIEFDPDIVFCHGCKAEDKPKNVILKKCTVRECTTGKKLESCIQCKDLKGCDKELWSRFPDFKTHVIGMQKTWADAGNDIQ